jgi:hypothetical protein
MNLVLGRVGMLLRVVILGSFPLSIFFLASAVQAEPWLGNRFAQNCAGCHAPGRKNFQDASKRRCTLACQGCHVSPNGSGLRSQYGKWTEDRWLKSFREELIGNKKTVAPYGKQYYATNQHLLKYGEVPTETEDRKKKKRAKKENGETQAEEVPEKKKRSKQLSRENKTLRAVYLRYGAPLQEVEETTVDEGVYDRRDKLEYINTLTERPQDFVFQIPNEDPYREILRTKVDGGADVRWQTQRGEFKRSSVAGKEDGKIWQSFLMSADLGLRWRPMHKKFHLVWEGRYFGQPGAKKLVEEPASIFIRRSLYVMIDDLPFATYVMAGFYRPIFGNPHPDHTLLSQRMMSFALHDSPGIYDLTYEALSFGGSPNVPYANVHLIRKKFDLKGKDDTNEGFAINGGGRFVSFGASVNFSYWRTKREVVADTTSLPVEARVEMSHIGFGGMLGPTTITIDGISIIKDVPQVGYFKGGVWQLETYTKVWREFYGTAGYHMSNTAEDLNPGRASQIRLGVKAFLTPGVEVSAGVRRETFETEKVDERTFDTGYTLNTWTSQIHFFM